MCPACLRSDTRTPWPKVTRLTFKSNTVQRLLPKKKPPASMSLQQLYSWQGGYDDRYRQGSQRVRVLAHSRASPRSETYHPSRTGGRGPGPYRPRSLLLLPIAGMVHGLACHRSGPVLLPLLPPGLPLAATVSPRRNPRAIYRLRGAKRLGIAPLRFLANQVIACRAAWSKRLVRLVRRREAWSVKD